MPVVEGREYRTFDMGVSGFAADGEGYRVEGYATTFDAPYDFGFGGMKECVRSDAVSGANMSDVIFQFDHSGLVLARVRNGTLSVEPDAHGLRVRADLGGTEAGRQLHEAIKNGLIDRMSWGFTVARDGWDYDEESRTSYITKVDKVFDVSAVSIPADEDTVITARSYINGVIERERKERAQRRERELALAWASMRLLGIGR